MIAEVGSWKLALGGWRLELEVGRRRRRFTRMEMEPQQDAQKEKKITGDPHLSGDRLYVCAALRRRRCHTLFGLAGETAQTHHMHMLVVLVDLTDQLVGGAFLWADVLRRCDDQLHFQPLTQLE